MASFPAFSESGSPYNLRPGNNCAICAQLPLDALAWEEDDGYPHHSTLQELEHSAETCVMCALLYWAAGCSLVRYGGMTRFSPSKTLPSGEQISFDAMESMYNGLGMRALENGAIMFDFAGPVADRQPPLVVDLKAMFPDGTITREGKTEVIRPWLFGNWYRSCLSGDTTFLMIGLGIRLGSSPKIEDSINRVDNSVGIRGTYLRYRTDKEVGIIPGRIRVAKSDSKHAMDKLKRWLSNCDQYHSCLDKSRIRPLPSRLLFCPIESREKVFLQDTAGKEGQYIALSHTWGSSHRLTPTAENLQTLRDGIAVSELPQTFQDAVAIAHELKIPYLWIDTLCFIQDDPADSEYEASHMGYVYGDAYLTVAASSSKDDSDGCFPDPNRRYNDYFVSSDVRSTGRRSFFVAAPVASFDGDNVEPSLSGRCHWATDEVLNEDKSHSAWIYITPEWMPSSSSAQHPKTYLIGEFGGRFDPIAEEALSTRGWALQERILSPRTIHYGRTEMYWECQNYLLAEDGAVFRRDFTTANDLWATTPREPGKDRKWRWERLIEEYSKRKLTKESDKLPGLSGLAAQIAEKTGDTYLAGLWKSTITTDLLWAVKVYESHHQCDDPSHDASMPNPHKVVVKHPTQYRAPSWSWASIDAEVDYMGSSSNEDSLATLVDVSVETLGEDACGRVESGHLTLRAPLYDLSPQEPKGPNAGTSPFHIGVEASWNKSGDPISKAGMAIFDEDPCFPCKVLLMTAKSGLVIREADGKRFKRIGRATFYRAKVEDIDRHPAPNGAVQEIVLV